MWVNVYKRLYAVAVNDDREKVITRIVCDFYNKKEKENKQNGVQKKIVKRGEKTYNKKQICVKKQKREGNYYV